jgi:hypothetical protein
MIWCFYDQQLILTIKTFAHEDEHGHASLVVNTNPFHFMRIKVCILTHTTMENLVTSLQHSLSLVCSPR